MGKKSKEPREDEEAVKSLFGTDNPKPTKKLRLGMDSSAAEKEIITEAKNLDVEHSNARKRKRDALSRPPSDEESIPRTRKKLVEEAEVDGLKKKNKRKIEEVKSEYEKRKFGSVGEEQPAAKVIAVGEKRTVEGMDSSAAEKETITEAKNLDVEHSNARKRKRDMLSSPSSDEESIARKRKKLVEEAEVDGLKKKNKRKIDEVESEYDKRKFGSVGEEEPAAKVIAVGEKRTVEAAAADMLNTKESFDDGSKLLRTVFVGNLPLQTKRKALNREFARFGDIESVRIRSMPLVDTKALRKAALMKGQINEEVESMNAYIVFKEEQSAHAALSNNMTQFGGKYIRVDMACPPRKKMKGDAQLHHRKRTG